MYRGRLFLLCLLCLFTVFAAQGDGLVPGDDCLEAALVMLEETNPFLLGYSQVTGKSLEAVCPLGCPYLWGGKSERRLLEAIFAWQSSPAYYVKGQSYLYGMDCSGFVQYIMRATGNPKVESISSLLNLPQGAGYDIEGTQKREGKELAECLHPGDLLAICHRRGHYHVGMYIGTLRDYGFTQENLPEALGPFVDYPLLIHCTTSGAYYERYEDYIEDMYDRKVYPPDGGVIVSVLTGQEDAPFEAWTPDNDPVRYFDLGGYVLTAYDISGDLETRWIRWRETDPYAEGQEEVSQETMQEIPQVEEPQEEVQQEETQAPLKTRPSVSVRVL